MKVSAELGQFMDSAYKVRNLSEVLSPGLIFYKDLIRRNISAALQMAASPARLRPHVKTHKTREIVRLELESGIQKHKCATLAEAEMLAGCGVTDVLIAFNLVGPNCQRLAKLAGAYPGCRFSVTADHELPLTSLSEVMSIAGQRIEVLLDIDVGQHRTGVAPDSRAIYLYELIDRLPALDPGGLHVYDGHNRQEKPEDRRAAVESQTASVLELRSRLEKKGLPVPRVVVGGTPTFPIHAKMELAGLESAPGTCFLHDYGYGSRFADLEPFVPAALVLSRVISRPASNRVTLDLGSKAVASDPPMERRCFLLDVPDYQIVIHNEEHLVIETPAAERFAPGDAVFAIPGHICPTCALHREAYVVENGQISDRWHIAARDRVLNF
jgi:D-serine deaminase-like pyridoxal phosphate-dependent protein